jgi:glucokinase
LLNTFGNALTNRQIFNAAYSGDPLAIKISTEAVKALSTALASLVNLLNPAWIVYGGGTLSDDWLMRHVREDLDTRLLSVIRKSLKGTIPSKLDMDKVGLLGAACLAMRDGEAT